MKSILFLLIFSSTIIAQNISSHKYFYNKYHSGKKGEQIFLNSEKSYKNPEPRKSALSSTVFGFLPDWEYFSDSRQYLRFDLLTHIAIFGWVADSTGALTPPLGWPWTDFINAAHQSGVKVVMTVISFDNSSTHKILTDNAVKENLINNINSVIAQSNLDGVNLDFEGLYESDRGNPVNSFTSQLNNFLSPEKEVSFDAPVWNWGGWDFNGLANAADYIFIMGYDIYGSWSSVAGPTSPLSGGNVNLTNALANAAQFGSITQSSPEKLILGIPYYGNHWRTETTEENSDVISFISSISYRTLISGYSWNDENWSSNFKTPWFAWAEDTSNQIWFDNDSSLSLKYELAKSLNLKGVGIWALGFDGNRTELWDLINKEFGNGEQIKPTPPVEFSVTETSPSEVRIDFSYSTNAESYLLYIGSDGAAFTDSVTLYSSPYNFAVQQNQTYYFKLCAVNSSGKSLPTHTLAASISPESSKKILIVDGFDRYYNNNNNFNFIIRYTDALTQSGISFSSANNETVILNDLNLDEFDDVIYFLGNESRGTESLNYFEQNKITDYLSSSSGRGLFLSGSEIGYDIGDENYSTTHDLSFYHNTLGANYVSDSPEGQSYTYYDVIKASGSPIYFGFSFDDGTHGTFDVGYPDAIEPYEGNGINLARYDGTLQGSGFAAIAHENNLQNRVVYLGFPFETIFPVSARIELMTNVLHFLNGETSLNNNDASSDKFKLFQNYPNPFSKGAGGNPTTTIEYSIPIVRGKNFSPQRNVQLKIYDILGREVAALVNEKQSPGNHSVTFHAKNLTTGIYFYKLQAGGYIQSKKMILMK